MAYGAFLALVAMISGIIGAILLLVALVSKSRGWFDWNWLISSAVIVGSPAILVMILMAING